MCLYIDMHTNLCMYVCTYVYGCICTLVYSVKVLASAFYTCRNTAVWLERAMGYTLNVGVNSMLTATLEALQGQKGYGQ